MTLERDDPFFRKPRPHLLPNGAAGTPNELLGFYVHPGDDRYLKPHLAVMTRGFWEFLHKPALNLLDTVEEKATFVTPLEQWLHEARIAERQNELRRLKQIGDAVRQYLGEIPAHIPPGGFENVYEFSYKNRLSAMEIEARIMSHLGQRGLVELFYQARERRESEGNR